MKFDLSEFPQDTIALIDSSAVQPRSVDFCGRLFKPKGLKGILSTQFDEALSIVELTETVMIYYSTVVIKEVVTELEEYTKQLNGHFTFIKEFAQEKSHKDRGTKKIRKKEKVREMLSINDETFGNLGLYHNRFFELWRRMGRRQHRPFFTPEQKETYEAFFSLANSRYNDIIQDGDRKKRLLKRPVFLGCELKTDQKIAATAFTFAYTRPVLLLTGDNGISTLLLRIQEHITYGRSAPNLPRYLPQNKIRITDSTNLIC